MTFSMSPNATPASFLTSSSGSHKCWTGVGNPWFTEGIPVFRHCSKTCLFFIFMPCYALFCKLKLHQWWITWDSSKHWVHSCALGQFSQNVLHTLSWLTDTELFSLNFSMRMESLESYSESLFCDVVGKLLLLFSCSGMSYSLRPHGLQHAVFPCLSLSSGVCSNSCPLSWWCHPTISSSVAHFSSCPQSFQHQCLSFPVSQLSASGGQSGGAFSFSISLSNEYSGLISLRIDWVDVLTVQGTLKSLLQHHRLKASIFQSSLWSISHICGLPLWLSW